MYSFAGWKIGEGTKAKPGIRVFTLAVAKEIVAEAAKAGHVLTTLHYGPRTASMWGKGEHGRGIAVDFMCSREAGDWIAAYVKKHADRLHADGIVWYEQCMGFPRKGESGHVWAGPYGEWRDYHGTDDPHKNHVHLCVWVGAEEEDYEPPTLVVPPAVEPGPVLLYKVNVTGNLFGRNAAGAIVDRKNNGDLVSGTLTIDANGQIAVKTSDGVTYAKQYLVEASEPKPPVPEWLVKPREKPARGSSTERITFESKRTTTRTRNMVLEQRRLYREMGGGGYPAMSQGGYNPGGVTASAGTHDQDAIDDGLGAFGSAKADLWETAGWMVGFAGWIRPTVLGLWGRHFHKLPKLGQLSKGAKDQVVDFGNGRSGLSSNKVYPKIAKSGLAKRTWEQYLAGWTAPAVSLGVVQSAISTRTKSAQVSTLQRGLNWRLGTALAIDGDFGPKTKAAWLRHVTNGAVSAEAIGALDIGVKP